MVAVNFTGHFIGLLILHSGHKVGSFRETPLKYTNYIYMYTCNLPVFMKMYLQRFKSLQIKIIAIF